MACSGAGAGFDEAAAGENADMARDGWPADGEAGGYFTDGERRATELAQDLAADRVA